MSNERTFEAVNRWLHARDAFDRAQVDEDELMGDLHALLDAVPDEVKAAVARPRRRYDVQFAPAAGIVVTVSATSEEEAEEVAWEAMRSRLPLGVNLPGPGWEVEVWVDSDAEHQATRLHDD